VPYQRLLRQKGEQMLILKLQGFLFFGTAHNLLDQIRQRVAELDLPPLRFVVFDFHLITGLDSSALNSFAKMKQLAEAQHLVLVFANLSPRIRRQFEVGGYTKEDDPVVRIFPDLDHGVEWCEDQVLIAEDSTLSETGKPVQELYGEAFLESVFDDIIQSLEQQERFESVVADMMPYFERQEVEVGHYLIRQGDPPEALYFIEFAQVTVQLESEDGKIVRLRTMGPGTVVGEIGLYLGQRASASIVVQEPGTVYRFSINALHRMQENDPKLAALFHEFMARLLGERLANMNTTLQALLD
jgi:SulP family sulfate permease